MFSDEGFGVEVVRYMQEQETTESPVDLIDGGTQGIYLLDYIEAATHLLVIDAIIPVKYSQDIYVYNKDELPSFIYRKMSSHQVGLSELISLARLHNKVPDHLTLIGVPPVSLDLHVGLSEEVSALVPRAATTANKIIAEWMDV